MRIRLQYCVIIATYLLVAVCGERRLVINRKYDPANKLLNETKREGDDLVLSCEYSTSSDENIDGVKIRWARNGSPLTVTSSATRSYVSESVRSNERSVILFTRNLRSEVDSGIYECQVFNDQDDEIMKRGVDLRIIKSLKWDNSDFTISATIGQPVEINCAVADMANVDISLELENGRPLPADDFVFLQNGKALLKQAKLDHAGLQVYCLANDFSADDVQGPLIGSKVLTIDVTYPPKFDPIDDQTVFGVKGSKIGVWCVVGKANPAVTKFEIFERSHQGDFLEILGQNDEYVVLEDLPSQRVLFEINRLEEKHFEVSYECRAFNGFWSSKKIVFLKRHSPAVPSIAQLEAPNQRSLAWQLEDGLERSDNFDVAPILYFEVQYVVERCENETRFDWDAAEKDEIRFNKTDNGTYLMQNLNESTSYALRFRAVNMAGASQWSPTFKAMTRPKIISNSAAFSNSLTFLFNLILLFVVIM